MATVLQQKMPKQKPICKKKEACDEFDAKVDKAKRSMANETDEVVVTKEIHKNENNTRGPSFHI